MTDYNDRKDENQLRKRVAGFAEPSMWALALFVSAMIPAWSAPESNLFPFLIPWIGLIFAIPASIIGYILGGVFGAPRLAKRAFLVVLCLGLWVYLEYIFYK